MTRIQGFRVKLRRGGATAATKNSELETRSELEPWPYCQCLGNAWGIECFYDRVLRVLFEKQNCPCIMAIVAVGVKGVEDLMERAALR